MRAVPIGTRRSLGCWRNTTHTGGSSTRMAAHQHSVLGRRHLTQRSRRALTRERVDEGSPGVKHDKFGSLGRIRGNLFLMPLATSSDGTRIHYDIHGTGKRWAVLIQGLGLSSRHWGDQADMLASAGFRVLTIDNRGSGRSDRVRRLYSISRMAEDVTAAMDSAGAPDAAVAGISMGGMIAQEVALRHPERTSSLVLLATTAGIPHGALPRPKSLATLGRVPLFHARGQAALAYRHLFFSTRTDEEAQPLLDKLMTSWSALASDRSNGTDFALQLRAAAGHSAGFRLKRLKMPVHVISGEDDTVIPARNTPILARLIKGASSELLPKVGHAIPLECPELLTETLDRMAG